ncbi:DUF397 domain-containing protein [Spirillospora sp. NPDC052269]
MGSSAPKWRKSSHSGGDAGQCVELADMASGVGVRDSKHPEGGFLVLARGDLAGVVALIKCGDVDLA